MFKLSPAIRGVLLSCVVSVGLAGCSFSFTSAGAPPNSYGWQSGQGRPLYPGSVGQRVDDREKPIRKADGAPTPKADPTPTPKADPTPAPHRNPPQHAGPKRVKKSPKRVSVKPTRTPAPAADRAPRTKPSPASSPRRVTAR